MYQKSNVVNVVKLDLQAKWQSTLDKPIFPQNVMNEVMEVELSH
jgi:hypothetical protein